MASISAKPAHLPDSEERERRAAAVRRHVGSAHARTMASTSRLGYVREQLQLVGRLSRRLTEVQDVDEMAEIVVRELHETFAFYLAAIQRLDDDAVLRLVAGAGPLAEVMTEFLLTEQEVQHGINGRVARCGETALVSDTRLDPDYAVRDPETDPRSELGVPIVVDGVVWGVLNIEAVERDAFDDADVVLAEAVAGALGTAIHRAGLIVELERSFTATLAALADAMEAKDSPTAAHGDEVADLAERVALRMGLSTTDARDVHHAALLHDIGKVAVPNEILLKTWPLTDDEWETMKSHVVVGGDMVAKIDAFAHLAPAVRASHERWDGRGYPDGLVAEEIPMAARIIAACDSYDAIVSDRPYRAASPPSAAREELQRVAGIQLDACVVEALLAELG